MVRVSVIGCGNMGGALVHGLVQAGHRDIVVCDVDPSALDRVSTLGVTTSTDPGDASEAEFVFVVVKPAIVSTVVEQLGLTADQTLISIAAGVPTDYIEQFTDAKVVRLMPNLAAETGTAAAAVTGAVSEDLLTLLGSIGVVVEVEEEHMDTATAVNGSGPAFVFYLIQAMAEAGVESGLDADDARVLAAQTFKGAAETILHSEASIQELIDAVCSPKGTTIEGMAVLRESQIDETIEAAVMAAERRASELAVEVGHE